MRVFDLLDRPIAFHRCFVDISGSVTAALFLSQAVYWQCRVPANRDGWWFKSRDDWRDETGLSRYEQECARKKLRKLGVLEEERRGVPAKLWYRVNETVLGQLLGLVPNTAGEGSESSRDENSLPAHEVLISEHGTKLEQLAKAALHKAQMLGVECEYVNYVDIIRRDQCCCYFCNQIITQEPGRKANALLFVHKVELSSGGHHKADNIHIAHASCYYRRNKVTDKTAADSLSSRQQINPLEGSRSTNQSALLLPTYTETTTEISTKTSTQNTYQGGNVPAESGCVYFASEFELENAAMQWAAWHPFWSTRITNYQSLQRNLNEGKSFRVQFLAACAELASKQQSSFTKSEQGAFPTKSAMQDDPHAAFWQRFSSTLHGTVSDRDDDERH